MTVQELRELLRQNKKIYEERKRVEDGFKEKMRAAYADEPYLEARILLTLALLRAGVRV